MILLAHENAQKVQRVGLFGTTFENASVKLFGIGQVSTPMQRERHAQCVFDRHMRCSGRSRLLCCRFAHVQSDAVLSQAWAVTTSPATGAPPSFRSVAVSAVAIRNPVFVSVSST